MSGSFDDAITRAARIVARGRCLALTGAGISVASGIPHFRSEGGLWEKFDPMEYATAQAWKADPGKVWNLFRETGNMIMSSKPNPAHEALASLERGGWVTAVVTQNIDGLHQEAGSREVVEFHGGTMDLYCSSCGKTVERGEALAFLSGDAAPTCVECGGWIRPSVVLFGEAIPGHALARSMELASTCRSILVVGTSAIVAPASLLPLEASSRGASIIEVNPEVTELSGKADVIVRGPAEKVLPSLLDAVEAAG